MRGSVNQAAGIFHHGKRHCNLAFERIGNAHHRHFGNIRVTRNAFLDLAGTKAVAGHVYHIVGAAQNEKVAVLVAYAPVKGAVDHLAGNALPVGFDKACVVLPNGLHATGRQRALDGDHTLLIRTGELVTRVFVQQFNVVAIHGNTRAAKAAGLFLDPVGDAQNWPAGLGLPVVVDDGLVQAFADPLCGRFIQRLAGQEKCTQA